jgi:hypothetical protein
MDYLSSNPALVAGLIAALVAVLAWLGDRRRMRRTDLDRVGLMPWQTLFFWAFMAAVLMLAIAGQDWLKG